MRPGAADKTVTHKSSSVAVQLKQFVCVLYKVYYQQKLVFLVHDDSSHLPLLCLTIRATGVIDKPGYAATSSSINHFTTVEVHDVSVPQPLSLVLFQPGHAFSAWHHLACVLCNEGACRYVLSCYQPPAFVTQEGQLCGWALPLDDDLQGSRVIATI